MSRGGVIALGKHGELAIKSFFDLRENTLQIIDHLSQAARLVVIEHDRTLRYWILAMTSPGATNELTENSLLKTPATGARTEARAFRTVEYSSSFRIWSNMASLSFSAKSKS